MAEEAGGWPFREQQGSITRLLRIKTHDRFLNSRKRAGAWSTSFRSGLVIRQDNEFSSSSIRFRAWFRPTIAQSWRREWQPHRTRPGVSPPGPHDRWEVADFLANHEQKDDQVAPAIRRIVPERTTAGKPFNAQACGRASLIVECEGAAPGTVVLWNDEPLQSTYGTRRLITAIVPVNLYSSPGKALITLAGEGEAVSNAATFVIEDDSDPHEKHQPRTVERKP